MSGGDRVAPGVVGGDSPSCEVCAAMIGAVERALKANRHGVSSSTGGIVHWTRGSGGASAGRMRKKNDHER